MYPDSYYAATAVGIQDHPALNGAQRADACVIGGGFTGLSAALNLAEQGMDVLLQLMDRYLGTRDSQFARWLISQATDEVAIAIQPDWLTAWDFSERMQQ